MILIHIGLKKSGSASLQTFLSVNEKRLREFSIDYAPIGRPNRKAHHNLASEIQGRRKFNPRRGTVAELAEYWRTAASRSLVISSEMFEEAEIPQISAMRDTLLRAREHEEFRIVLIIRNLVDLIPSSYGQKVKYGFNTYDFDSFFAERMRERRINYFDTAQRWADIFGWQNMAVRLLDPNCLRGGDLVSDVLATAGLAPQDIRRLAFEDTGIQNSTPGWKVLEAVRALYGRRHRLPEHHRLLSYCTRGQQKEVGRMADAIGAERGWNSDRGNYLTREQAQSCLNVYRTNIERLNKFVSEKLPPPESLDSRGFQERKFLPDMVEIPEGELRDFYDQLANSLN